MLESLPLLARYGDTKSTEHKDIVRSALNDIISRMNEVPAGQAGDVMASVMLTWFANQIDPVAAFEFIVGSVGVALVRNINEQQVGHG